MAELEIIDLVEPTPEEIIITDNPDGGATVEFGVAEISTESMEFSGNLAEYIPDKILAEISSELTAQFENDQLSRAEWEDSYVEGLEMLGLNYESRSEPWDGASGVHHPLLAEAVVRFQSDAISAMFPAQGPVKTKIMGDKTPERVEQARRVEEYMNWQLTEQMSEFRSEQERMLFALPLSGSGFKKVYYDAGDMRPKSMFVDAADFVVHDGTEDLKSCERAAYIMRRSKNWVRKMQVSGFYRDVDLGEPEPFTSKVRDKMDELRGIKTLGINDNLYTLIEFQVDYDIPGFEDTDEMGEPTGIARPYVITLDHASGKILGIRRNWREGDPSYARKEYYIHYQYLPGFGFYAFGLLHLIGGLLKSTTSILRQLIDAGTLANLPGGLKTRGLRIKGDDTPIAPGEFRDVDVASGTLRENITFLPTKEPSNVLYQLLGNLIDAGQRFASATDLKIADMGSKEAPVGTTLALIERSMKVMSAIQARLHAAQHQEFKLIAEINYEYGPSVYPYEVEGREMMREDFAPDIDVIPQSDPNAATMSQRVVQHQAALQLQATAPDIYNKPALHRRMLEVLGIDDPEEIVPLEEEVEPADPVTENMAIMMGKPVKAFEFQDHQSHIQVHMAAVEDPKIRSLVGQSPLAGEIQGAMAAHVAEHVAFQYRREIEKQMGVPLPPHGKPLPEDVENRIAQLTAAASDKLLRTNQAEEQQKKAEQLQQDPMYQLQKQKADTESFKAQKTAELRNKELDIRQAESREKLQLESVKLGVDIAENTAEQDYNDNTLTVQQQIEGAKIGVDIMKNLQRSEDLKRQIEAQNKNNEREE
jgi:hypothetical protein